MDITHYIDGCEILPYINCYLSSLKYTDHILNTTIPTKYQRKNIFKHLYSFKYDINLNNQEDYTMHFKNACIADEYQNNILLPIIINSYMSILELFLEFNFVDDLIEICALLGRLDILEWCLERHITTDWKKLLGKICLSDRIEVSKWLYVMGIYSYCVNDFESICKNGNLEFAKWFCKNIPFEGQFILSYIENGNVNMLKWLSKKFSKEYTGYLDTHIKHGHLEMAKYLHEECGEKIVDNAMMLVCFYGHLNILEYLWSIGMSCSEEDMKIAAGKGHVAVVDYIFHHVRLTPFKSKFSNNNRVPYPSRVKNDEINCAKYGNFEMIKQIYEKEGCSIDEDELDSHIQVSILYGYFEIFKYLFCFYKRHLMTLLERAFHASSERSDDNGNNENERIKIIQFIYQKFPIDCSPILENVKPRLSLYYHLKHLLYINYPNNHVLHYVRKNTSLGPVILEIANNIKTWDLPYNPSACELYYDEYNLSNATLTIVPYHFYKYTDKDLEWFKNIFDPSRIKVKFGNFTFFFVQLIEQNINAIKCLYTIPMFKQYIDDALEKYDIVESLKYVSLDIFSWTYSHPHLKKKIHESLDLCAQYLFSHGNLDIIRFLSSEGCEFDKPEYYFIAGYFSHVYILEWFHNHLKIKPIKLSAIEDTTIMKNIIKLLMSTDACVILHWYRDYNILLPDEDVTIYTSGHISPVMEYFHDTLNFDFQTIY